MLSTDQEDTQDEPSHYSVNVQVNGDVSGNLNIAAGDICVAPQHSTHSPPSMVPRLPSTHVPRSEDLANLRSVLLHEREKTDIALHGMGGIGKTTLAIALCHDQQIADAFPDGILWAELGPDADVRSAQQTWAVAIGHGTELSSDIPRLGDRARLLSNWLDQKRCLLVIDDVWEAEHLSHMMVGGKNCATLVTTREKELLRKYRIHTIKVDRLDEEKAITLLEKWAGRIPDHEKATARELVWRLGYLPLALKLAGAQIENEEGWSDLLAAFQNAQGVDLTLLDFDDARTREESLALAFRLSVDRLDSRLSERFRMLGVFGNTSNASLNVETVAAVWDIGQKEAKKCLVRLCKAALLDKIEVESQEAHYIIHPLLADYASMALPENVRREAERRHGMYCLALVQQSGKRWREIKAAIPHVLNAWEREVRANGDALESWSSALQELMSNRQIDFYDRVSFLDTIRANPFPSDPELVLLLGCLQDPIYASYFFEGLTDPSWVKRLHEHGAFADPPSGSIWAPSLYLERVAQQAPDDVLAAILSIETDNPSIQENILRASQQMPVEYSACVVESATKWIDRGIEDWMVIDLARFLAHLVEGAEYQAALALYEKLLTPVIPNTEHRKRFIYEPNSGYSSYWLQLIMGAAMRLLEAQPLKVVQVLHAQLEEANRQIDGQHAYWRRTIEDHEENSFGNEYLNTLLSSVRELMERLAQKQPEKIRQIVRQDLENSLPIFQRLAIHLVRTQPQVFPELVSQLAAERRFLNDFKTIHEYELFLHECFRDFTKAQQDTLIEWIQEGPPDVDDEERKLHWSWMWLSAIREQVPQEILDQYNKLEPASERSDEGLFLTHIGPMWVGPESPMDKDELAKLSDRELIALLQTFEDMGSLAPSRAGLARVLGELVVDEPERFAKLSVEFSELDLNYVYHLLGGLENAWKVEKGFNWEPVVSLVEQVVQREEPQRRSIEDLGKGAVLGKVATLLQAGVDNDQKALPPHLLSRARNVLIAILAQEDPDLEWVLQDDTDPIHAAINSAHGQAMRALLSYALHYSRTQLPKKEEAPHETRLEPEVKDQLSKALDETIEPNISVRVWYGGYLPQLMYLDEQWVQDNLTRIFPSGTDHLWYSAWGGYMFFVQSIYLKIYKLLRSQYQRAIDLLSSTKAEKEGIYEPTRSQRLPQHLAILYLEDIERLQDQDSLLEKYLSYAPDEKRAAIPVFFANRVGSGSAEEWEKLKKYWQAHSEIFNRADDVGQYTHETQSFAMWLDKVPEHIDTMYDLVQSISRTVGDVWAGAHYILEYLNKEKDQYPVLCGRILKTLFDSLGARLTFASHEGHVEAILEAMIQSGEDESYGLARDIINRFGESGIFGYKSLLY